MNELTNEENSSSYEKAYKDLEKENVELKKLVEYQRNEIDKIIEQRTRELIDLVETKDKFYRIIAHELRNPFNSILGFLDLLLKNLQDYDLNEIEKFLTIIYRSTNVSFELLVSLSEWLNAQSGGVVFKPENANINQLLSDAILSAQFKCRKKTNSNN